MYDERNAIKSAKKIDTEFVISFQHIYNMINDWLGVYFMQKYSFSFRKELEMKSKRGKSQSLLFFFTNVRN